MTSLARKLENLAFWLGLFLVAGYWLWTQPAGPGYIEDFCGDISRRVMAENLKIFGKPVFWTDLYMAPTGMAVPFFSWSIERDWFGAYFWLWNKEIPFVWCYFLASLLGSYFGVGYILRRMGLGKLGAWLFAALVVSAHIPRHFKLWHHFEYVAQHWVYWSVFLDAWIWQRFYRERKWSWNLELWRGVCLIGVLGTPGYMWGPMMLEWGALRIAMIVWLALSLRRGQSFTVEGTLKRAWMPLFIGAFFFGVALAWFLPLYSEMKKMGDIPQPIAWFAHLGFVIRPLWLDQAVNLVRGFLGWFGASFSWKPPFFNSPETIVSIGWFHWVPVIAAVVLMRKRKGGPGLGLLAPYLVIIFTAFLYFGTGARNVVHDIVQGVVPFMSFFRVTSRWGMFLPYFTAAIIVLSWPELSAWVRAQGDRRWKLFSLFAILSLVELSWLAVPVNQMPELHESTANLLEEVHQAPGTTVLDMPFCVAGGNGICTSQQCPNYPKATVGACFSTWHEKKVYGLYQARLVPSQCEIYNRRPYVTWFDAWARQRCLMPAEWDEFCSYLDEHPELSAVLVYPGIWTAAASPECRVEFENRLGKPLSLGRFASGPGRGQNAGPPMAVFRYSAKCVKK